MIDEGLGGAAAEIASLAVGRQQGTPGRFNDPIDDPAGMSLAQGGDGRQSVQDVAHRAQPDHEQAKLGLRVQNN
jgi:hypothetical protein